MKNGEDTGDTGQKPSKSSSTELPSTSSSIGIVARHVLCKPAGIPRPPVTALERLKMGPEPGRPALSAPCAYAPSVCHPEPWSSIYCPSLSQQPSTPTTYKHTTHTHPNTYTQTQDTTEQNGVWRTAILRAVSPKQVHRAVVALLPGLVQITVANRTCRLCTVIASAQRSRTHSMTSSRTPAWTPSWP